MAIADVTRVVTSGVLYGATCVNVYHYETTAVPSSGSPEADIAERFKSLILSDLVAILSEDFIFDCLDVTKIHPAPGTPYHETLTTGNVGTVAVDALPPNRCYQWTLYSETLDRHGRGRKYFSGIPETWEDDNCLEATNRTALEEVSRALEDPLSGGAGGGQYKLTIVDPAFPLSHPVVYARLHPAIRSIRGRTAKRC